MLENGYLGESEVWGAYWLGGGGVLRFKVDRRRG